MEDNIWSNLTEQQGQGVITADIESENEDNLIDFENLKKIWMIKQNSSSTKVLG